MRRLVALDARKLLDGDLRIGEACSGEVGVLEFGQRLRIEGALELLEDVGELCMAYWLARGLRKGKEARTEDRDISIGPPDHARRKGRCKHRRRHEGIQKGSGVHYEG